MGKITMLSKMEQMVIDSLRKWAERCERNEDKDLGCIHVTFHSFKMGEQEDDRVEVEHSWNSSTFVDCQDHPFPQMKIYEALAASLLKDVDNIGERVHKLREELNND